jgi:uncharacterized protein with PQ loop repeat/ribosomal protein S20
MKYLKRYKQHNEDIRSTLAKAALATSLLTGSPQVKSQTITPTNIQAEKDGVTVAKNNALELSKIRKSESIKDSKLHTILQNIEQNIDSNDVEKFTQLFTELSKHLEDNYGYKIESKPIEQELVAAGISDKVMNMSAFEIMGWLGSILLAICGIPQAIQSYKEKHSHGISWGFILLWTFGEIFALAYVYDKLDLPLVLNYATNILILGVILYYKINPSSEDNI